ncbi:Acetylornithine deacetylase/Succinyl-diaminopimelate desuccinylase [Nannocystis exedens]|uniref:N-acetyl-L-citrulline deacetylase n=1 Tax=Nannocystis exedens TaxID=54 RepID=A0A1I1ZX28_9BACT|nr:M20/M25/M40 family metallo-hydrolase [Nannocystis exedens]PCC75253.1 Acetylornithine deacetylase [Nannocystis exedens]SFE36364.1 Acetylornithine deacetylase/Succinyl-diaminopimelate desuccinylase [Nannocystis exedens]
MTEATLRRTLEHLGRLVAFDTRNPPRAIAGDAGLFAYLRDMLQGAGLACDTVDLGDGCVYLLAVRGAPQVLFNVHVDTVPADPGWTADPHVLRVEGDRAIGLGACDIKGAAACLLSALETTTGPAAVLFSSDEEAGSSRCVREFLARSDLSPRTADLSPGPAGAAPADLSPRTSDLSSGPAGAAAFADLSTRTADLSPRSSAPRHPTFRSVVVGEPTRCRAVLEHRGIGTATAAFSGTGGHASAARALRDSAVHEAVRWASLALARAEASEAAGAVGPLRGLRLNLGAVEGGLKANMIASAAAVRFGVRPPPELPPAAALAELFALAPDPERVRFTPGFLAPPLPAGGPARLAEARAAASALAARLGLPPGDPVDFWTEAALFSAAGCDVLVYGPGSIEQAHTAGEYVPLADLVEAASRYRAILS